MGGPDPSFTKTLTDQRMDRVIRGQKGLHQWLRPFLTFSHLKDENFADFSARCAN
jgi:hypothetical protein